MKAVLVVAMLITVRDAQADGTLCERHEAIVFSCHIGKKIVSLCRPKKGPRRLRYRFGTPAHVDVEYPERNANEPGAFYTSRGPRFGGGEASVAFTRDHVEYTLYSRVGRAEGGSPEERIPTFEDGLIVLKAGGPPKISTCDDGGDGFRESIDWIPAHK
jgi:hypothetical protein